MTETLKKEFANLSLAEKIRTAEDLWEVIAQQTEDEPIPKALLAELEQRAKIFEANPGSGFSIEQVEQSLFPE